MKILAKFKDDYFPFSYIDHTRQVGRAIVLNNKNEILMLKIQRDDQFGNAIYYETPGGGVNENENLEDATIREVQEECGLDVEIISEIGMVEDDYNLIHRHNISAYFLTRVKNYTNLNREFYETQWIKDMIYFNIDELIHIMERPNSNIEKVVYRREKIILEKVKELL